MEISYSGITTTRPIRTYNVIVREYAKGMTSRCFTFKTQHLTYSDILFYFDAFIKTLSELKENSQLLINHIHTDGKIQKFDGRRKKADKRAPAWP